MNEPAPPQPTSPTDVLPYAGPRPAVPTRREGPAGMIIAVVALCFAVPVGAVAGIALTGTRPHHAAGATGALVVPVMLIAGLAVIALKQPGRRHRVLSWSALGITLASWAALAVRGLVREVR